MFPFEEVGGGILLSSPLESRITLTHKANHKAEDSAIKKAFSIFSVTLLLPTPPHFSLCCYPSLRSFTAFVLAPRL